MREPDEVRLTERPHVRGRLIDPADLLKRIVFGVIGSCLFSAIMFFMQVKAFIAFILAAILTFLGWTTAPPRETKEAGERVFARIENEYHKRMPPIAGGGMLPLPRIGKSPEQAEAERQHRLDRARAEADAMGLAYGEDWTLEKLQVETARAKKEKADAARREQEARKRKLLTDRATNIGMGVNPDLDLKELEKQVEEGERAVKADADYQLVHQRWQKAMEEYRERLADGPNARCPDARCRYDMRISKSRIGKQFVCSKCRGIFPVRQAMAHWTPPPPPKEPVPPSANPGIIGRMLR